MSRNHQAAPVIVGENYRPACEQCDVPPWEDCACSFNVSVQVAAQASPNAKASDRRHQLYASLA